MNEVVIQRIQNEMLETLSNEQMTKLTLVLSGILNSYEIHKKIEENTQEKDKEENVDLLNKFIESKEIEGCSNRTIKYYNETIMRLIDNLKMSVKEMTTDDLRNYLSKYKTDCNLSTITEDNIRRILSSFFSWLEDEDYIVKSPIRRIHKVKTPRIVKETFSDEDIEKMRDNCSSLRNLAIIEILNSSGMRVGELVRLNKNDIDFENRSCIVLGKGNSEREVYFDAKTKIHLKNYILSRGDNNDALFVSKNKPNQRLSISGIELIVRKIGNKSKINKVHPHKFRRTLATTAIDKGMPIEQVQKLLGHVKIDTTMHYAMVNQNNVKISHRKYIG